MLSDVRGWIFQRACRHLHIPAINLRSWFAFLSPQSNGLHFTLPFFFPLIREMTQQGNSPYLRPGFLKNPINTFPHCLLKMGFPVEHSQEWALCGTQRPNNGEHNWGAVDKFGGPVWSRGHQRQSICWSHLLRATFYHLPTLISRLAAHWAILCCHCSYYLNNRDAFKATGDGETLLRPLTGAPDPFHQLSAPLPPPAQGETLIIGHMGWGLILLWQSRSVCRGAGQRRKPPPSAPLFFFFFFFPPLFSTFPPRFSSPLICDILF